MPEPIRHLIRADSPPTPGSDGVSDWFTILRTGQWDDSRYGELVVTRADLESAVSNFAKFKAKGVDLPVDYDHSFALSGESKAAGWYENLRVKGENLEAQVKWTPDAAEAIRKGEYKFFSSEYDEDYSHSDLGGERLGFTILSGGLTNRPAVKGLGTVALAEPPADESDKTTGQLAELACAMGGSMGNSNDGESPGRFLTDSSNGVTLADPQVRSRFLTLAEDNNKLNKVVEEIVRETGKSFSEAFSGVMAVIDATREREELDESEYDAERLELSDRLEARVLREGITLSEAIEREGD